MKYESLKRLRLGAVQALLLVLMSGAVWYFTSWMTARALGDVLEEPTEPESVHADVRWHAKIFMTELMDSHDYDVEFLTVQIHSIGPGEWVVSGILAWHVMRPPALRRFAVGVRKDGNTWSNVGLPKIGLLPDSIAAEYQHGIGGTR